MTGFRKTTETSVKITQYVKILKIEIEATEKSKETRVKYSPASIPTCKLLESMHVQHLNCNT